MPHTVNHYDPQPLPPAKSLDALPQYVRTKTSWNGIERLIPRLMEDFHIYPGLCIEHGVWHGYSTAALANCFQSVIGADIFVGDVIPGTEGVPMIETTRNSLSPWNNIELRQCSMEEFDYTGLPIADLIHIDASHNYKDWFGVMRAIAHCRVAIFHDTGNWFVDVPRLIYEIAERFNLPHFHFPHHEGLDILVCANMLNAQDHVEIRHFTKQGLAIEGVVHVGANDGYEIPHYLNLGAKKVIAIEPQNRMCDLLMEKFKDEPRVHVWRAALGDQEGNQTLHVTQDTGMGSSLLVELPPPPNCEFEANTIVGQEDVPVMRMDGPVGPDIEGCNVLVMDVQGMELQALKGFGELLKQFEMLNVECSREPVYEGGAAAQEVIDFLASQGFKQETPIKGHGDIMFRQRKSVFPGWNCDDRMLPLLEPHHYVQPPGPMVYAMVSGRHWNDGTGSWEQCIRTWDQNSLFRHPRYHVTGKPMMQAYEQVYRNTSQEIIAYIHDDVSIFENTWDDRVLKQFEDPQVGLVGFFGATGHCLENLYSEPCKGQNFVRLGVRSNMVDAEVHGERFTGECDVVVLDGLALFVRRKILDNAGGWPQNTAVSYWCYDYWLGLETRRQGYKIRLVGVNCQHHASKTPSLINENWEAAHQYLYDNYRDVLPARV